MDLKIADIKEFVVWGLAPFGWSQPMNSSPIRSIIAPIWQVQRLERENACLEELVLWWLRTQPPPPRIIGPYRLVVMSIGPAGQFLLTNFK